MERQMFGHCEVAYTEVDGLLVTAARSTYGRAWTACRDWDGIGVAVRMALALDYSESYEVGHSLHSEEAAIRDFRRIENDARMLRNEKAGKCHCGHGFYGSDHCPLCGCEQYEAYCDTYYHDSPAGRVACECSIHNERSYP